MPPRLITISDIVQKGYASAANYRNLLLVSGSLSKLQTPGEPCRFDATLVFVCLSGSLTFSLNMRTHTMQGPFIAIVFSGDVLTIESWSRLEGYAAIFSNDYLNSLEIEDLKRHNFSRHVNASSIMPLSTESIDLLRPYHYVCKTTLDSHFAETDEIMRGLARAYCMTVISVMKGVKPTDAEQKLTSRQQQIFNIFTELVAHNYARERNVAFYASEMHLSPKYLSVSVRECSGRSAQDWINDKVMIEAKSMLRNSRASIKEIAYQLNFPTQSAFGKFFRHCEGCSPRQYRQRDK